MINIKKHYKIQIDQLIIEGCDCVGKDALIDEFNIMTDHSIPIINRLWASMWVYGKFKKRNLFYDKILMFDKIFAYNLNTVLVYVTADNKTIEERIIKKKETDIINADIKPIKTLYEKYLKVTKLPKIIINTTNKTPKQCAKELIEKINLLGRIEWSNTKNG